MKLTRDERKAIFGGDHRAIRRNEEPQVAEREQIVLSYTRGGKQFVEREEEDRLKAVEEGHDLTVPVPRKPAFWIVLKKPRLKEGEWIVEFDVHDERETTRLLAAGAPSGVSKESGLKTRWRKPGDVPKRGEQTESFTPESERGYASGGNVLDHLEGVDDTELAAKATISRFTRSKAQDEMVKENAELAAEALRRRERAARDRLRMALKDLPPEKREELLAAVERECQRAEMQGLAA